MRSSGICVLEYNAFAPACEVSDEPRHDVGFLYLTSLYKLFVMVSKKRTGHDQPARRNGSASHGQLKTPEHEAAYVPYGKGLHTKPVWSIGVPCLPRFSEKKKSSSCRYVRRPRRRRNGVCFPKEVDLPHTLGRLALGLASFSTRLCLQLDE
jgi:hypothetical protein